MLVRTLRGEDSSHDFGRDVIPSLLQDSRVIAYDFHDLNRKQVRYWRDVGTLDAYYDANMDLVAVTPEFNLYDPDWPMRTWPATAAAQRNSCSHRKGAAPA